MPVHLQLGLVSRGWGRVIPHTCRTENTQLKDKVEASTLHICFPHVLLLPRLPGIAAAGSVSRPHGQALQTLHKCLLAQRSIITLGDVDGAHCSMKCSGSHKKSLEILQIVLQYVLYLSIAPKRSSLSSIKLGVRGVSQASYFHRAIRKVTRSS